MVLGVLSGSVPSHLPTSTDAPGETGFATDSMGDSDSPYFYSDRAAQQVYTAMVTLTASMPATSTRSDCGGSPSAERPCNQALAKYLLRVA